MNLQEFCQKSPAPSKGERGKKKGLKREDGFFLYVSLPVRGGGKGGGNRPGLVFAAGKDPPQLERGREGKPRVLIAP